MNLSRTLLPAVTAAALLAAAPQAPSAAEHTIDPGFWEARHSALIFSGSNRRCVREQDVARYIGGWENSIYDCTYPVSVVGGGTVRWEGTCVSRGGRHLTIRAQGTYTNTSFTVRGHVSSRLAGVNVGSNFTVRARRLGDCSQFPNESQPQQRR
jgi:hypothetical protein